MFLLKIWYPELFSTQVDIIVLIKVMLILTLILSVVLVDTTAFNLHCVLTYVIFNVKLFFK